MSLWQGLLAFLVGYAALELWKKFALWIGCALKDWLCWYLDRLLAILLTPMIWVLEFIPEFPSGWFANVGEIGWTLDKWAPVSEVFTMAVAYWLFWMAWVAYRNIKSLIPLVSN